VSQIRSRKIGWQDFEDFNLIWPWTEAISTTFVAWKSRATTENQAIAELCSELL